MKDKMTALLAQMEESLDDQLLSRKERKDLKALIQELNFEEGNKVWLLSKFRDLALSAVADAESEPLLAWFYEGAKLVLGADAEVSKSKGRAYFSPGDACRDAILYQLANAKTSIDICVFTISDNTIRDALLASHKRGVKVRIISDNDKAHDLGSDLHFLQDAGIAVRTDLTKVHMHHKFALFDRLVLVTGSYNWTRSAATSNYENIVVLEGQDIIPSFVAEFKRLWDRWS